MSLVILEGLDRTGKSTVAKWFESQGYELIHLSAPSKAYTQAGYTGPSYLDEMIDLIQTAAAKDVVLDRSHYGELVWPQIYNRKPLLNDEDFEILREIEDAVGVKRILMTDKDAEAHWQRCVDNNEPLTKAQFARARSIYATVGQKYGFETITLPAFVKEFNLDEQLLKSVGSGSSDSGQKTPPVAVVSSEVRPVQNSRSSAGSTGKPVDQRQLLEKANAINDVLALSRILKQKGALYDELESDIRAFLNDKLGAIFGNTPSSSLNPDEIVFLKALYKRAMEKEN